MKTFAPCHRLRTGCEQGQHGMTLIETLIACTILLVMVIGVLPVFIVGFQTTEQQGNLATRTTQYAQDKMESLVSLEFNDGVTDTTVFPPNAAGGTGLGGTMAASSSVGGVPPAAAAAGYADYLDINGSPVTSSASAYYTRQWEIATDSTDTLKTIAVVVTAAQGAAVKGLAPSVTLVSIKSSGL
jgi:type II secretory pathway pseudopilin PulG